MTTLITLNTLHCYIISDFNIEVVMFNSLENVFTSTILQDTIKKKGFLIK